MFLNCRSLKLPDKAAASIQEYNDAHIIVRITATDKPQPLMLAMPNEQMSPNLRGWLMRAIRPWF